MLTARVTLRDRELLDRLAQHEPLSTSELCLLFFTGARACRGRLLKLEQQKLLSRVYPSREWRGGATEALWFLSPHGRKMIGAPSRRPPGLSIPDLEHRRAVASFFIGLVKQGLAAHDEGLYRWLGEHQAQQGTGPSVRPDGFGRYLLKDGEITFYLEVDRGTETTKRVKDKLAAYQRALAADRNRDRANILLVCEGRRRLTSLARCAPAGPPWVWGTTDHEHYRLLPTGEQERAFHELSAWPCQPGHRTADCMGRRWRQPTRAASRGRAA
jgi:Replication-relaxation